MIVRPYPRWDPPEIDEWDDGDTRYAPRCLPLAALALGTVGIFGAFAFCRPRRYCRPSYGYAFGGCRPYRSCSPTYICYPRTCYPFAG